MFTTNVRAGKAFAAKPKIRELKKIILKIKEMSDREKTKITPTTTTTGSAEYISNIANEKYKLTPEEIEEKLLASERLRVRFNFTRVKISKKSSNRLNRFDKVRYKRKKATAS